jgi:hypothetical protein
MDDTFMVEVRRRLREFGDWSERLTVSGYRLATAYPEIENLHVYEISRPEAEDRIEGYLCEGLFVDWAEHDAYVYLLVWENPDPHPAWRDVFAAGPIEDIWDPRDPFFGAGA